MTECKAYAAAQITFLDRETGKLTAYTYPVTEVILRGRDDPHGEAQTFRVDEHGHWYHASGEWR